MRSNNSKYVHSQFLLDKTKFFFSFFYVSLLQLWYNLIRGSALLMPESINSIMAFIKSLLPMQFSCKNLTKLAHKIQILSFYICIPFVTISSYKGDTYARSINKFISYFNTNLKLFMTHIILSLLISFEAGNTFVGLDWVECLLHVNFSALVSPQSQIP